MANLWIANTTKQVHIFQYRPKIGSGGQQEDGVLRPVYGELRKETIPVGGQICVSRSDLKDAEIRVILDQHPHIPNFNELNMVKGYQGLCYRIGPNPVPMEEILERIETNDKARTDIANDRQMASALEIAGRIKLASAEGQTPYKDLRETDVQVAQHAEDGVNAGTPKINQVVEVPEQGKEPSGRGRRSAA